MNNKVLLTWLFASVCMLGSKASLAEDDAEATVQAPANCVAFKHTATGAVFVDKDLSKQYRAAKSRFEALQKQRYMSAAALESHDDGFALAEKELADLASRAEKTGVLCEPFTVYKRRETKSIELSPSAQIVITADDVTLRGWDGKNIKCVIEKSVLGTEEPDESEFDAIQMVHKIGVADQMVGATQEVRDRREAEFLASDAGRKLTPGNLKAREGLLQSISGQYDIYKSMQGQSLNSLQLTGLIAQEGNVHLTGEIESPGGGKTIGGYWRRSAKATIYVPACDTVAVRGCMGAVDIKSVEANLIPTTHGSRGASYGSDFRVSDIAGNVSIEQVPIRIIDGVSGSVHFLQTNENANSSTRHSGDTRVTSSPPPHPTVITDVEGDFMGEFSRADLTLQKIAGSIDVMNEYGNTRLSIQDDLKDAPHRIVSHSGVIRLAGKSVPKDFPDKKVNDLVGVPVHAFTQIGDVKIRGLRKRLESKNFTSSGRGWVGFQSSTDGFAFGAAGRPTAAWNGESRKSGLDLISSSGVVIVESAKE